MKRMGWNWRQKKKTRARDNILGPKLKSAEWCTALYVQTDFVRRKTIIQNLLYKISTHTITAILNIIFLVYKLIFNFNICAHFDILTIQQKTSKANEPPVGTSMSTMSDIMRNFASKKNTKLLLCRASQSQICMGVTTVLVFR